MKKRITLMLSLIVLLVPCLGFALESSGFQNQNTKQVEEIDLKISFPIDFLVLTRDNMGGMEAVLDKRFGTTKEAELNKLRKNNAYIMAYGPGSLNLTMVSRTPNTDPDYDQISDLVLLELSKNFYYDIPGYRTLKVDLYKTNGLKWIVPYIDVTLEEDLALSLARSTGYSSTAVTTENGYLYAITIMDMLSHSIEEFEVFVETLLDSVAIGF